MPIRLFKIGRRKRPAKPAPTALGLSIPAPAPTASSYSERLNVTPERCDSAARTSSGAAPLRQLIDDADRAAADLRQAVRESRAADPRNNDAASRLQDRLRLGARMLKALQTQVERAETATQAANDAHTRLMQVVKALETKQDESDSRTAATIRMFEAKLDEVSRAAMERVDQQFYRRENELNELEERFSELMSQTETIAGMVETAEVNVAATLHRAASAARAAAVPDDIDRRELKPESTDLKPDLAVTVQRTGNATRG